MEKTHDSSMEQLHSAVQDTRKAIEAFRKEATQTIGSYTTLYNSLNTLLTEYVDFFKKHYSATSLDVSSDPHTNPGYTGLKNVSSLVKAGIQITKKTARAQLDAGTESQTIPIPNNHVDSVLTALLESTDYLDSLDRYETETNNAKGVGTGESKKNGRLREKLYKLLHRLQQGSSRE